MDVHLEISDILLGLYALAFIVVAFIQKAQIKNLQTTIDNFEKLFKLDDLVKYSDMRYETTMTAADKILKTKADEILTPRLDKELEDFKSKVGGKFEKQFDELANITFLMLSELPEKDRKDLMNDTLPISKTLFEPLFQEIENNSNS